MRFVNESPANPADSAAASVGLLPGDVVTAVDGERIYMPVELG